jgi:hypothetical protein
MVKPDRLEHLDSVAVYNTNWTCRRRLSEECECGKIHYGWIMSWRYQCELWWDTDSIWDRCVTFKEYQQKKRKQKNAK